MSSLISYWLKRLNGISVEKAITLAGNNTTVAVPLFTVVGRVKVLELYGVVTTVIGVNHTAAYFRVNDQTAQAAITLATGTAISAAPVGSLIVRRALAATAVTLLTTAAARVSEGTGAVGTDYSPPFVILEKAGALTQVEYVYSTTDAPTTGAIKFYIKYLPLTPDSSVVAV